MNKQTCMRAVKLGSIVVMVCVVGGLFLGASLAGESQGGKDERSSTGHPNNSQSSMEGKFAGVDPPLPLEEFVRQFVPSSLTYDSFSQIKKYAKDKDAVSKLKKLLAESLKDGCKGGNLNGLCSNIVMTLGVIGTPESLAEIKDFLNQDVPQSPYARVAITDAVRALGVWVNLRSRELSEPKNNGDQEYKEVLRVGVLEELGRRTNVGLQKSEPSADSALQNDDAKEKAANQRKLYSKNLLKGLVDSKGHPLKASTETDKEIMKWERRLRRAAIQSLAFSGSQDMFAVEGGSEDNKETVKKFLESLLAKADVGTSFRAFILEMLSVHNIIARVGVDCYLEQEKKEQRSDECRARWAGKETTDGASETGGSVVKE